METIRNYLETMFSSLPNTAQVHKAKAELYGMMEDKYNALMSEGMDQEAAIAKVIAEFGSLSEIADELGIADAVDTAEEKPRRAISGEEIDAYIRGSRAAALQFAASAALIVASFGCKALVNILADYLYESDHVKTTLLNDIGMAAAFIMIAVGVGIMIMAYSGIRKWEYLFSEPCQMDYPTLTSVDQEYQSRYKIISGQLALGVGLCIVSVVPPLIFDDFYWGALGDISSAIFWIVAAVGVAMIVLSERSKSIYRKLLSLNGRDTVGGNQLFSQKQLHFDDPMIDAVMSMYWQTVLCLYLSWSFLTFEWLRTWIIWPVAGLLHWLVRHIYSSDRND